MWCCMLVFLLKIRINRAEMTIQGLYGCETSVGLFNGSLVEIFILKFKFLGKFCWISKLHVLISVVMRLHVDLG